MGRECIVASGPRRISAPFRGTGALGPGVDVGVCCAMMWGFSIDVGSGGIVLRWGLLGIRCDVGRDRLPPLCYVSV